MKRIFLFWAIVLLLIVRASAQYVHGVVVEAETGEPLPTVHVYYMDDKSTLVQTDINGKYKIAYRPGTIVFSMTGFDPKAIEVKEAQKLNIKLMEKSSSIQEVTISRKRQKYSRKNNPAVEMMRKVIAAKKSSNLYDHDYLSFMKYEKMTTALNEFTDKVFDDDHFKRFPFLKEHVEVYPETGKLILPLVVDEKVRQIIYRKDPKQEKSIIIGQREDGVTSLINTGEIFTGMLSDCFTDIDIYKDQVRLLQHPFTSPIATSGAIEFYRYFIVDTLMLDKQKCFQVDFTPNNPRDFGFSGSLYILADSTWRLKRAEIGIPSKSEINFVEQMNITQDFEPLPSGEQVVVNNKMLVQLELASWIQKMQVERVVKYSGWDFTPIADRTFRFKGDTKLEASAEMRDESFWEEHRPTPLTKGENTMDLFMQRLYNIKGFKQVIWVGKALIENYVETSINPEHPSKVDIGPINTMIGSNYAEGLHLRASAQTTANLNPHLFLRGNIKYGFGDEKWKGLAEVTYSFNKKDYLPREYPCRNLTFSYENDVMSSSDKYVTSTDRDNVFSALKWAPVRHMNYFERYNVSLDWEWENGMRLFSQFRRENNVGAGQLFYQPLNGYSASEDAYVPVPRPDVSLNIHKIKFAEFTAGLEYQPGATYINTKQRRLTTNYDSPIFGLSHTTGIKGLFGGQYNYNVTEAKIYKRFWFRSWGKVDVMLKGGIQWNKVPYPFLIIPASNMSYITEEHLFYLVRNMEFPSDRYASLMVSWDLNGKLFNRIPGLRELKWREFFAVNTLWGQLTDRNNPFLERNRYDSQLFYFPGSFDESGNFRYHSHIIDPKVPYVEVVAGIHNIFKIFHIEYVRRLNYIYDNTHKWGVRFIFRVVF